MDQAAEESQIGVDLARDTKDLVGQLISQEPTKEIGQLQQHLLQRIDNAVVAAKQLKEDFNNVRAQLLLTRKSVPGLKDGVQEYGEAAVPAGAGLLAAVASVTAILFPPMATKARELRDTADPDKRLSAAQAALGVLNGIEPGLDHAIVVVGQLITFGPNSLSRSRVLHPTNSLEPTMPLLKNATNDGRILRSNTRIMPARPVFHSKG